MKKGERTKIIFMLAAIVTAVFLIQSAMTAETVLEIPNTPPFMKQAIPNQTWPKNSNFMNAFDLDEYFDDSEDLLFYSYTAVQNITIEINETTNAVSFYPDANFTGTRNTTFTAFDSVYNLSSNVVFLNVITDNEPPKWYSPAKSTINVYQNNFVEFSTVWEDNTALSYYIFSINQNNGWIVHPSMEFSGKRNISAQRVQISAPEGTNVSWKFLASDTQGNTNETNIQSFIVASAPASQESPLTTDKGAGRGDKEKKPATQRLAVPKGFLVTPSSLIIKMKQGETLNKLIKIDNVGGKESYFTYSLYGLGDFAFISHANASIKSGKSDILSVEFYANRRARPDIYNGKITIVSGNEKKEIPVVLTVNPLETEIEIRIKVIDEFKKIMAGETVRANVTIENKKDIEEMQLSLYTSILDYSGNILDSRQEIINFSEKTIALEREFVTGNELSAGEYIFFARASRDKIASIDLDTFIVGEKFNVYAFIKANYLILILIIAALLTTYLAAYYKKAKERERLINLYVMINELKTLLQQDKIDDALDQYVKIKLAYGEKVPKNIVSKDELKAEMEKLINGFEKTSASPASQGISSIRQQPPAGQDEKEHAETGTGQKIAVQKKISKPAKKKMLAKKTHAGGKNAKKR